MLLEGYLKNFTLSCFLGVFKIIKILGFLAHTQPAQANCQRRLSLRRPFFSAGSAWIGKLLAQAHCVRKFIPCFFQRTLSLRRQFFSAGSACAKKTKIANICRSLRKKTKFYPVLKSPTHIGFIDVKNGSKISHLGTFKISNPENRK